MYRYSQSLFEQEKFFNLILKSIRDNYKFINNTMVKYPMNLFQINSNNLLHHFEDSGGPRLIGCMEVVDSNLTKTVKENYMS